MPLVTIFTPTYNRAYTLPKLYDSLCQQTCKDFIWLIVDDGSTDGTQSLISQWTTKADFPIVYHKQKNGGKMRAHNRGVSLCTTPLFVCVDSDDCMRTAAIASIVAHWETIEKNGTIAGMIAYCSICQDDGNFMIRCKFPFQGISTIRQLYNRGFFGDTTLVFKTEVIRCHPFLEIEGEKFSTESYAYEQIDRSYSYLLVNESWKLCTYMPDGYTQNEKRLYRENPKGWAYYYNQRVAYAPSTHLKQKIGYTMLFFIFARRAKFRHIYQMFAWKTPLYPLLWLLSYYYEYKWREKYPK